MQTSLGRQFGHTGPVGLTRVLACRRRDTSRATRRGKTRTRRRCCWWRDSQAASCGGYAMPRRSRSHARRTTTGVLALLTRSNEGIFHRAGHPLSTLVRLTRNALITQLPPHTRVTVSAYTCALSAPLSPGLYLSLATALVLLRRTLRATSWHHSLLLDTWASTPSLVWGVDTSSGAC